MLEIAQGYFLFGEDKLYISTKPWNLLIPPTGVLERVYAGQGSEDAGKPAAGPGVFRQGQVVQHPGGRLEHADPPAVRRPAGAAPHPPGDLSELLSRLLRFLRGGRLPKLYETFQLVEGSRSVPERAIHARWRHERKWQNISEFFLIFFFYSWLRKKKRLHERKV